MTQVNISAVVESAHLLKTGKHSIESDDLELAGAEIVQLSASVTMHDGGNTDLARVRRYPNETCAYVVTRATVQVCRLVAGRFALLACVYFEKGLFTPLKLPSFMLPKTSVKGDRRNIC